MSTESAVKLCEICKEVPATKGSVCCAPCRAADYERSNTLNLARSYATELDADKKSESAVKPVVHYVRRWSGNRADEAPLCGSNQYFRTIIGNTHDSAGEPMDICPACKKIADAHGA